MQNTAILERLDGIRKVLVANYEAGCQMSSPSQGREREILVSQFLKKAFPIPFRFGQGDVTDTAGHRTGQFDIVVEYPFLPSVSLLDAGPRLYLAEGVAAIIEVKSNIRKHWADVQRKAQDLSQIKRDMGRAARMTSGNDTVEKIPLFAVGYAGWENEDTVRQHLEASPEINGILVIDPGIFVGRSPEGIKLLGRAECLWGLLASLHHCTSSLQMMWFDLYHYATG